MPSCTSLNGDVQLTFRMNAFWEWLPFFILLLGAAFFFWLLFVKVK